MRWKLVYKESNTETINIYATLSNETVTAMLAEPTFHSSDFRLKHEKSKSKMAMVSSRAQPRLGSNQEW